MKLRRRHLVLLAVALLIAALIAWRYRPLNETERKLVGTWHHPGRIPWDFSDTRNVFNVKVHGRWRASESTLYLRPTKFHQGHHQSFWSGWLWNELKIDIEFDGTDRIYIEGIEYHRDSAGKIEWKDNPSKRNQWEVPAPSLLLPPAP